MKYADSIKNYRWFIRLAILLVAVYVFLFGVELFGCTFKCLGKDAASNLFKGLNNPFAGLAVGILATVLVQSSSVTTSTIVAMVSAGELSIGQAVPMVMGANIGTSITNTLVALNHITRSAEFRRAFAGAMIHDLFNILTVAILLPLELLTGFLQQAAHLLVEPLKWLGVGGKFDSPIKTAVKYPAEAVQHVLENGIGLESWWLAVPMFIIALVAIIFALIIVTKNMRALIADKMEEWINRVLKKSGLLGISIGTAITALVQSSSITTSLMIPMFGAGILTLEAAFPVMLGANLGTTVTAILASMVGGIEGLEIALVHFLFNLSGILIFFPFKRMRQIPIKLSQFIADKCTENRIWVLVYIGLVFIVIPIAGILIWR